MTMNKDLLELTAAWLEAGAPERRFDMSKMVEYDGDTAPNNWCGTTCCIAGYVWQMNKTAESVANTPSIYGIWDRIEREAAKALGLDFKTAHRLFYPTSTESGENYPGYWHDITADQAAQAVRNVINRGASYWEDILDFTEEDYA